MIAELRKSKPHICQSYDEKISLNRSKKFIVMPNGSIKVLLMENTNS